MLVNTLTKAIKRFFYFHMEFDRVGERKIKKSQILLYAVSICYVVIVIGATFFSRIPSETYNDRMNLNLFSSYVEAYHDIGVVLLNNVLLRNLILNIIFKHTSYFCLNF